MLKDEKAKMKDLRKGFVFFMEQEKADLKRHAKVMRAAKLEQKIQEVDAPKEWWEDDKLYHPISHETLDKNEWLDVSQMAENFPPYEPVMIDQDQTSD